MRRPLTFYNKHFFSKLVKDFAKKNKVKTITFTIFVFLWSLLKKKKTKINFHKLLFSNHKLIVAVKFIKYHTNYKRPQNYYIIDINHATLTKQKKKIIQVNHST